MHDFFCLNPADMHYDVLADRVKFFKESNEGTSIMCRAMEEMRNQALQEGIKQGIEQGIERGKAEGALENANATARCLLAKGRMALDEIAEISGLPLEQVTSLSKATNV